MRKLYLKTLFVCLGFFGLNAGAQTTFYVKTDGATGATATSWTTASNDLQEVINAAVSGDKIFVAVGTYWPNRPANDLSNISAGNRDNAFVLKNGVSIYGGFVGTESHENERLAVNRTILSGDLSKDDVMENSANTNNFITLNKGDNTYHVVLAIGITSATIFDGFTLTRGDASVNSTLLVGAKNIDRRLGGGLYIVDSGAAFKISNVIATINRSAGDGDALGGSGSGFYLNASSPTIESCEFVKNFNTNTSPKAGGYNYGSGLSIVASSNPIISNTVFSENFGGYGAAAAIHSSNPTFTNCTFKLNRGNGRGGAIDIRVGLATFNNCLFSENTANGSGGAIYNYNGRGIFYNCIFYRNNASNSGAAYGSEPLRQYGAVFVNNTFYANRNTRSNNASGYTAGIHVAEFNTGSAYADKKTHLYNSIFYDNVFPNATGGTNNPDLFVATSSNTLTGNVFNNLIQQIDFVPSGQFNQSGNPLFISVAPGGPTFLAPGNGSPAKDNGDDNYNTTLLDFNGNARKNGTIDIGAVEFHSVLPVSFMNFTAKVITGGIQLNWKVSSETNNKRYIISRSTDGKNYDLVRTVTGIGTSTIMQSYGFADPAIASGTYYYKLEQEDLDGNINYLATAVVNMEWSDNRVEVYPNPARSNVTVALKAGSYHRYSLVGLQGNTVLNGTIAKVDHQINLDLSNIARGTYIIKLIGLNGNHSARVIKL